MYYINIYAFYVIYICGLYKYIYTCISKTSQTMVKEVYK